MILTNIIINFLSLSDLPTFSNKLSDITDFLTLALPIPTTNNNKRLPNLIYLPPTKPFKTFYVLPNLPILKPQT